MLVNTGNMYHSRSMDSSRHADRILRLAAERRLIRARDLSGERIPRAELGRLVRQGRLEQISRGLYTLPGSAHSDRHQLAEVATLYPRGVFCLLTALRFHEMTTQSPHEIWMAIPNKSRPPKIVYPPLRVFRFSGPALREGVEAHRVDGVAVQVYSVAKTVADCFKYRNKIGLDVALEALRECLRNKRATRDELWRHAKTCRVANVMRPYLDSIE